MTRWLVLRLEAPLMAFGGVTVDQVGPVRPFPALSALTGLFGNALGWDWTDRAAHQALQDRLVFASRTDRAGRVLTDMQNAQMAKADKGWTTRGTPEGRAGASYDAPHRRKRDYVADRAVRVVLRLTPGQGPDLRDLARALIWPARPLFIGRKPCLPSQPLFHGWTNGDTAHEALLAIGGAAGMAEWPMGEGPAGERSYDLPDRRDWISGLHMGRRVVLRGQVPQGDQPTPDTLRDALHEFTKGAA